MSWQRGLEPSRAQDGGETRPRAREERRIGAVSVPVGTVGGHEIAFLGVGCLDEVQSGGGGAAEKAATLPGDGRVDDEGEGVQEVGLNEPAHDAQRPLDGDVPAESVATSLRVM